MPHLSYRKYLTVLVLMVLSATTSAQSFKLNSLGIGQHKDGTMLTAALQQPTTNIGFFGGFVSDFTSSDNNSRFKINTNGTYTKKYTYQSLSLHAGATYNFNGTKLGLGYFKRTNSQYYVDDANNRDPNSYKELSSGPVLFLETAISPQIGIQSLYSKTGLGIGISLYW